MNTFASLLVGVAVGGFIGFIVASLLSALKADAYQQQEDDEAQVQALLDYQAMTSLEREFPIAR